MPLLLAIVAIVIALALVAILGQAFELSFFVVNMLTAMGLALGIDYALFVVSRYREERAGGREKLDAIAVSARTATRAVFVSGLAFVLAMFGMVIVPDTILRSLAVGAILVGIVAVVAALTLLPAVLSLLGDRVDRLRVPFLGRRARRRGRPLLVGDRPPRAAAAARLRGRLGRVPARPRGAGARHRRPGCPASGRCRTATRRRRASCSSSVSSASGRPTAC